MAFKTLWLKEGVCLQDVIENVHNQDMGERLF